MITLTFDLALADDSVRQTLIRSWSGAGYVCTPRNTESDYQLLARREFELLRDFPNLKSEFKRLAKKTADSSFSSLDLAQFITKIEIVADGYVAGSSSYWDGATFACVVGPIGEDQTCFCLIINRRDGVFEGTRYMHPLLRSHLATLEARALRNSILWHLGAGDSVSAMNCMAAVKELELDQVRIWKGRYLTSLQRAAS